MKLSKQGAKDCKWRGVCPENVEQGCSGNPKAYEFSKPVLATVAGYVMLGRFTYWHGGAFEFDGVDADFDRDQPVGVTH